MNAQEQKPLRYEAPHRSNQVHKALIDLGLMVTTLLFLNALVTYTFSTDDRYDDSGDYFSCCEGKKSVENTKAP